MKSYGVAGAVRNVIPSLPSRCVQLQCRKRLVFDLEPLAKMPQATPTTSVSRNRVCVVTGATRGIGRATALSLAKLGAQVVLVGRDSARMDEVRRDAKSARMEYT